MVTKLKKRKASEASQRAQPQLEASAKLVEAIRELVRDEIKSPHTPPAEERPAEKPSRADAFWLALCLINLALLVWWVPVEWLEDKRIDFVVKVVPLAGAYFFALGYMWWGSRILSLGSSRLFKAAQILLILLLLPLNVSQLHIFPVRPHVDEDAVVWVDGLEQKDWQGVVRLSLRRYAVQVRQKESRKGAAPKLNAEPRDFVLTPDEMLRGLWSPESKPQWPLFYDVSLHYLQEDVQVTVERLDGAYDPAAGDEWRKDGARQVLDGRVGNPTFVFKCKPTGTDAMRLPAGRYVFTSESGECAVKLKTEVTVAAGALVVDGAEAANRVVELISLCK